MNKDRIDTLIFDLGGVIIDLDINKTIQALARMASIDPEDMVHMYWHHEAFHHFEKGQIEDGEFREFLRKTLKIEAEDTALDLAWNAMILDIPQERLEMLQKLKEDYRLFLLSNTNTIHLQRVNEVFVPMKNETLDHYFDQAYYSHLVGMRKPDADIYEKVIDDHALDPSRTIFFDDNEHNIRGAGEVGIQTFWVKHPDDIKAFFNGEEI